MTLSILIPTVVGREACFEKLYTHLSAQIKDHDVEVLFLKDNKELSIGAKRQKLLEMASGDYMVMIDDDDWVPDDYVFQITYILKDKPDCIGYLESVTINGEQGLACHSNRFKDWGYNQDGYQYVRTIFYKDPIRTDIARKVGIADMRYGEDHDFARRLKASGLLKKEIFYNRVMYYYTFNSMKQELLNQRYGIK